jgi:hypothetical protein
MTKPTAALSSSLKAAEGDNVDDAEGSSGGDDVLLEIKDLDPNPLLELPTETLVVAGLLDIIPMNQNPHGTDHHHYHHHHLYHHQSHHHH